MSTSGLKFKIPIIQQKTIVSKATQGFALGYDLRTNVNNEDESLMTAWTSTSSRGFSMWNTAWTTR